MKLRATPTYTVRSIIVSNAVMNLHSIPERARRALAYAHGHGMACMADINLTSPLHHSSWRARSAPSVIKLHKLSESEKLRLQR